MRRPCLKHTCIFTYNFPEFVCIGLIICFKGLVRLDARQNVSFILFRIFLPSHLKLSSELPDLNRAQCSQHYLAGILRGVRPQPLIIPPLLNITDGVK